ncbi:MAG: cysteine desulfurase family protein [Selenomonadaceae bacterium]|jgi:cysteine desulfurase|nr:cysteine desulfurase family protein [Selenomonadaceae bacterium]
MKPVYLDYAATTPPDPRVTSCVTEALAGLYGNPSSQYSFGRDARAAVEKARRQTASLLGASPEEIFFTSGGSESDNWALKGMAFSLRAAGRPCGIVTTAVEHHAVLRTCEWLSRQGFSVRYLPVDREGKVSLLALAQTVDETTGIVSVMLANNEVGTIEPVAEIGAFCRARGIFFHTDGVQAVGHLPVDVQVLGVDALSLSGHKLYAPKGVGALYLRRGVVPDAFVHGGAQERGLRAGTENVPAIVGLGCAAALAEEALRNEAQRLRSLRERLAAGVREIRGSWCNGPLDAAASLPGHLSFGIAGIRQDTLLIRLDMAGFAVSAGSACSAGSLEPSHVLRAMGQDAEQAQSALRVTIGRFTTEAEVAAFLAALKEIVVDIRRQ